MFKFKTYERQPKAPLRPNPHPVRATMGGALKEAVPKEPAKVRSEDYRRLVAGLPCVICGLESYCQAAHPNAGKTKGVKANDLLCFPLCSVEGNDCHAGYDQYRFCSSEQMPERETLWAAWTQAALMLQADTDRTTKRVLKALGMLP